MEGNGNLQHRIHVVGIALELRELKLLDSGIGIVSFQQETAKSEIQIWDRRGTR